jgi:hypothetical protein
MDIRIDTDKLAAVRDRLVELHREADELARRLEEDEHADA